MLTRLARNKRPGIDIEYIIHNLQHFNMCPRLVSVCSLVVY